jgi:hypothetical protein
MRGHNLMKTHRISTTISQRHWAILNKYSEKFSTQQKVLEFALENLEKASGDNTQLSKEDEIWVHVGREIKSALVIFQKDYAKILLETADIERFREYTANEKPVEFIIEYYYHKPLKDCSLKEIIDAIILNIKIQNSADAVNYTDDGDHYTINISHSMGLNMSIESVIMHESVFKAYGAKFESHYSERNIFFKLYKNLK